MFASHSGLAKPDPFDRSIMSEDNGSRTTFPDLPAAPPSHVVGQGYSAHHKVPTVQSYKDSQARNEEEANQYAQIVEARHREAEEREKLGRDSSAPQGDDVSVPTNSASPMSAINNHAPPAADGDAETVGDSKEGIKDVPDVPDVKDEKNVVKSNANKKHDAVKSGPATEKEKMMEQMNANQSGFSTPRCWSCEQLAESD